MSRDDLLNDTKELQCTPSLISNSRKMSYNGHINSNEQDSTNYMIYEEIDSTGASPSYAPNPLVLSVSKLNHGMTKLIDTL